MTKFSDFETFLLFFGTLFAGRHALKMLSVNIVENGLRPS